MMAGTRSLSIPTPAGSSSAPVVDRFPGLRRRIERQPQDPEPCFELAARLYASGAAEEAVIWLRSAAALDPGNARYHYHLGVALEWAREPGPALNAYREACRLAPDSMEAWNDLGVLLCERDQVAEGADALRRAVELAPDDADAWSNLGSAYGLLGEHEREIAAYRRAVELDPGDADSWYNLGVRALEAHDPETAATAFRRSLHAMSGLRGCRVEKAQTWNHLGIALVRLGHASGAGEAYREAIRLDSTNPLPHYNRALWHRAAGRLLRARRALEKALALSPRDRSIGAEWESVCAAITFGNQRARPVAPQR